MPSRVDVAPWLFVTVWWSVALVAAACCSYHAIVGLVYLYIPVKAGGLLANLEVLGVSIAGTDMPLVGGFYIAVASGYALGLLSMVWSSVRSRRLVFTVHTEAVRPGPVDRSGLANSMHRAAEYCSARLPPKGQVAVRYTKYTALAVWRSFSVSSPNYGVIYVARELIQTCLQTYQAYRLSAFISRPWMNNMIVILLVINCLVSPLIQFTLRLSVSHTRLLCIVANLALDLVTAIGFPLALALPYYSEYDPVEGNFDRVLWYTEAWIIQIINEWQILFVTGTVDGLARLFIAYNLGRSLYSIGGLIHVRDSDASPSIVAVFPAPSRQDLSIRAKTVTTTTTSLASSTPWRARLERWGHGTLALWALAVTIVHTRAVSTRDNPRCLVQVHPWFTSSPACSLMEITCINSNRTGGAADFDAALDTIEREWLAFLIIRHCPAVEISPRISELSWLLAVKIYNATIVDWPLSAALTQTSNPETRFVLIVKTNLSQVPPGLYHHDFPARLVDLEFVATNLTTLPPEVADVWLPGMFLAIEESALTEIPEALTRLRPSYLSIVGNSISDIPVAVLENPWLLLLIISDNPIQSLPPTLNSPSSIWWMGFAQTQVQTLPAWVPPIGMMAGDSPFCDALAVGNATALGVAESEVDGLRLRVDCRPADQVPFLTFYPTIYDVYI